MAHRSQPNRATTPKEPRNKDRATRSMGQFLAREEDGQDSRRRILSFPVRNRTSVGSALKFSTTRGTPWT